MTFYLFGLGSAHDSRISGWLDRAQTPSGKPWDGLFPLFGAHCSQLVADEVVRLYEARRGDYQISQHLLALGAPRLRNGRWQRRLIYHPGWEQLYGAVCGLYVMALTSDDGQALNDGRVTAVEQLMGLQLTMTAIEIERHFGDDGRSTALTTPQLRFGHTPGVSPLATLRVV